MSKLEKNLPLRAAILGVMSGMRSMAGIAAVVRRASDRPGGFEGTVFGILTNSPAAALATFAQVGEIVADKLPFLPNRIDPMPLAGRALFGAASGAAVFTEARKSPLPGAVLGAAAAVASAHLFYRLRVGATGALPLPDFVLAVAEDGAVFALERAAAGTYE